MLNHAAPNRHLTSHDFRRLVSERSFVIFPTALGSPGSSAPSTSGLGADFPAYTIGDMVASQKALLDAIGVGTGPGNRQVCGIHPVDLAHPDPDGGAVGGQQDRVALHRADRSPGLYRSTLMIW